MLTSPDSDMPNPRKSPLRIPNRISLQIILQTTASSHYICTCKPDDTVTKSRCTLSNLPALSPSLTGERACGMRREADSTGGHSRVLVRKCKQSNMFMISSPICLFSGRLEEPGVLLSDASSLGHTRLRLRHAVDALQADQIQIVQPYIGRHGKAVT
ncbi:hypothetical protein PRIPAC_71839 [Pristionchus pacificus]|uniref:Uncharacterized protein n=1 Tax=Pristionchus pacificus TaxID=54126 RepID=A0A2A6CRN1_PRIPA|nr:hypothetical protein PRIPAC_71839 [Pristionchus pacificus]|eukprot:PDM80681.1 hypothetical protein PRIPAC_35684 [Pristionchus pacificus]